MALPNFLINTLGNFYYLADITTIFFINPLNHRLTLIGIPKEQVQIEASKFVFKQISLISYQFLVVQTFKVIFPFILTFFPLIIAANLFNTSHKVVPKCRVTRPVSVHSIHISRERWPNKDRRC